MKNKYIDLIEQTADFPTSEFRVEDNELYFNEIPLMDIIEQYGTPLKITYLPRITQQIQKARRMFNVAMAKVDYNADYHYCYCTKSSHFSFILEEVLKNGVNIETSSAFDINLIENLYESGNLKKDTYIICNGFKRPQYVENIQNLINGKLEQKDYDSDIDDLWDSLDSKASTASLNNLNTTLSNKISTEIKNLKEELKSKFIPSGAVMFFDLEKCPTGWTALNSAGAFIRDIGGEAAGRGVLQEGGVPNLKGWNGAGDHGKGDGKLFVQNSSITGGSSGRGSNDSAVDFDASRYSSVYKDNLKEVRPKNIAYLACIKK